VGSCGLNSSGSEQRPVVGSCEHGRELDEVFSGYQPEKTSSSLVAAKAQERMVKAMSDYQLLNKDSAPWN
jgi:hypothetical protein